MNLDRTILSIKGLGIDYPSPNGRSSISAIKGLNLDLAHGEIGCLLGSSGCVKSSVLRAICGFEKLTSGEILLRNQVASSPLINLPTNQRRVGMVFQDFALFPHLNILDNVAFGIRNLPRAKRMATAMDWLQRVSLSDKAKSYPHELSGGQQQRVALARAMAPEPDLILLDEPFSSLDVDLRERLAGDMRDILKANQITALLVTHDQLEAFAIADKIGVMKDGQVIQWDAPYELYHQPINRYVADFIGRGVLIKGVIQAQNKVLIELGELDLDQNYLNDIGQEVDVLLREDDIHHDDDSPVLAEVVSKTFKGADFLYTLKLPSGALVFALVPSHHNHAISEKIGVRLAADHVVIFMN